MTNPITDPNAWELVDATVKSFETDRAGMGLAERVTKYVEVVTQFNVATNPRYVRGHNNDPKDGEETYCNIFLCDSMAALVTANPPPHWQDPATGIGTPMGKGRETSANGVCDWFARHGLEFGWMECGEQQARRRASAGYPTCVLWFNPGGIGHVAVVLPGTDFTHTAQAGGTNFFDGNMRKGFGGITALRFYSHD